MPSAEIRSEERVDVVIVGSGFGGSVMAYRLAKASPELKVCLLERGKKWPPGRFPRTPLQFGRAMWNPSEGLYGLYDVWSFGSLFALVSSGLGGGSLIYANVLLPKDRNWFAELTRDGVTPWPIDFDDVAPHYKTVLEMMKAAEYPEHLVKVTPKAKAFDKAGEAAGLSTFRPPLAITYPPDGAEWGRPFDSPEDNIHRAQRYTCRLVGECDAGCNFGSKNTLDFTYLSQAERLGADIRCLHEVKRFEPNRDGFLVYAIDYTSADEGSGPPALRVFVARRLILSAGALGTPYLLLRNRSAFPRMSHQIGTRFSGNGDFLTFAARCNEDVDPAVGPVITTAVRVADALDKPTGRGPGHYIEDGGYPALCAWIAEMLASPRIAWMKRGTAFKLGRKWLADRPEANLSAEIADLLGDRRLSAGTLPMLAMGREPPQGRMSLRDGMLHVDWKFRRAKPYFERVRGTMSALAEPLGGSIQDNVLWRLNAVITVHPLGGCPLGRTAAEGVVDPVNGEVHNYPGLHVADGSVMPGTVGANPSLTIAALADRFADAILEAEKRS